MMRKFWLLGAAALIYGCATPNEKKIAQSKADDEPLPAAAVNYEVVDVYGVGDPAEGFNRLMFDVNDFFMMWVFRPVGHVYGSIMPQKGVECINNFTDNIAYPGRLVNNLFQAEFKGAGVETLRFLSNSTIGIAGLFDPAWNWFYLPKYDEDFGQTFAVWGIGPGCFLMLPGMGPTTVRDAVGAIFDAALDPKTYFYGGQAFTFLNRGMAGFSSYESMHYEYADPYRQLRDVWIIDRQLKIENYKFRSELAESDQVENFTAGAVNPVLAGNFGENKIYPVENFDGFYSVSTPNDTLRSVKFGVVDAKSFWPHLSFFNQSFARSEYNNTVLIPASGEKMRYNYWASDRKNGPSPLVVIIPGIGVNCHSSSVKALAEVFHNQGCAVIALSSPFNWQFVESMERGYMPGYMEDDIKHLKRSILLIEEDIKARYKAEFTDRIGVGYSLGALEALYITATDDMARQANLEFYNQGEAGSFFNQVIAINPPLDLLRGVAELDGFYDLGSALTVDEFKAVGKYALNNFMRYNYANGDLPCTIPDNKIFRVGAFVEYLQSQKLIFNGTDQLSGFMVGFMFRRNMSDMLYTLNRKENLDGVAPYSYWNGDSYEKITTTTFREYVEKYLLPNKQAAVDENLTVDKMNYYSSVKRIGEQIGRDINITVIHSQNDFLLSESERIWLYSKLGERVKFFSGGGHLGNMSHWKFRRQLVDFFWCSQKAEPAE